MCWYYDHRIAIETRKHIPKGKESPIFPGTPRSTAVSECSVVLGFVSLTQQMPLSVRRSCLDPALYQSLHPAGAQYGSASGTDFRCRLRQIKNAILSSLHPFIRLPSGPSLSLWAFIYLFIYLLRLRSNHWRIQLFLRLTRACVAR